MIGVVGGSGMSTGMCSWNPDTKKEREKLIFELFPFLAVRRRIQTRSKAMMRSSYRQKITAPTWTNWTESEGGKGSKK